MLLQQMAQSGLHTLSINVVGDPQALCKPEEGTLVYFFAVRIDLRCWNARVLQ